MIAVVVFAQTGLDAAFFVQFAFACALVAVAYIDLDHQIIPDVISLPGIVLGLLVAVIGGWAQLLDAVVGVLVGGGILLTVAWAYEWMTGREGMGGGDVKLLAMIGSFVGPLGVIDTLLAASIVGLVVGVSLGVLKRNWKSPFGFGPSIAAGAVLTILMPVSPLVLGQMGSSFG